MSAPLVSIVMATYRSRHDHLRAAITSALAQSMGDIEVIVSDDSPDDALSEVVAGFRDERLRYRHNAPALGVARNHWVSFGEARGEFIVILNHDDLLEPRSVETLMQALCAKPHAVLAFADHWIIDADGQRMLADTDRNTQAWGRSELAAGLHQPFWGPVVRQSIPMAMGAMFRRDALTVECPPSAGPAYDLWLTYQLARSGAGAVYVPERLSAWRTHAGNLTSQAGLDWLIGTANCWQAMAADPLAVSIAPIARRQAARWFYVCARLALRSGHTAVARQQARLSWQQRPSVRGAVAWLLTHGSFWRMDKGA
jgi:glycosyltransferase involved in cell wall biosynthesis